jgi:hypothetical protein
MNGAKTWLALPDRNLRGVDDELRTEMVSLGPADDPPGEHIENDGQVEPSKRRGAG